MSPAQHHFVAGVAALAFDDSSKGVLEALASRAKRLERPLLCTPSSPAGFTEDLSSAMSGLLNPQNPAVERVDHAHVLIVTDLHHDEHSDLMHAVCSTVLAARKKFQSRMGRAILAVRGGFHPVGRAANGRVHTLPRRSDARRGTGVDAFDLVVLLDARKADGSSSSTPEDTAGNHAAILANLMLSDFEDSIYKLLEHQRGPLGSDGLFASFGVAELPFSSHESVQSIAAVLWRKMAMKILHDATVQLPMEAFRGESWKEDLDDRLAAEPLESADTFWIDKFHRQGAEKLQGCFEESAYHPGVLLRSLAQREEYLIRFRDRARTRLTAFMDEFVPRHAPVSSRQDPERTAASHRQYGWTRIAILLVCLVGFSAVLAGILIAGSATLRFPGLLVLALLTGSAITLLLTRRSGTEAAEAVESPQAAERDVIAELRRYRAGGELAAGILKRHRKLRKLIETDIEALQAEVSRPCAAKPPAVLALPESLIDELLTANGLDVQHVLLEFWEQAGERLAVRPAAREISLPQRLRRYAASRCAVFSGLRMNDVLGYLGGPAALDRPQVSRQIDRLQTESNPWMPVDGLAAGIIVALPETLNPELRRSIAERFPDPVFVVPMRRESIVALQWTQGYTEESVDADTPAMAL